MIQLTNAKGTLKKISNNHIFFGQERVTAWTLPVVEVEQTRDEVDVLFGKYTSASWFNQRKDGVKEPMDWWKKVDHVQLDDIFDIEDVEIVLSGEQTLTYASRKGDDGETIFAGKLTKVRFKAIGDKCFMSFHLQIKPKVGKDTTLLLQHEDRRISFTFGETTARKAEKEKQQDLALTAGDGQEKRDGAVSAAGNGTRKPIDGTTAASRAARKSRVDVSPH